MVKTETISQINVRESLDSLGFAHIERVLSAEACKRLRGLYSDDRLFRTTIDMERYRFGRGEYKYFRYPLPDAIQSLREEFYFLLASIANDWMERLQTETRYPGTLNEFLALCHSRNQVRPTPLMLHYREGGYNTLHQDIYGEVFFPFQVVFMLTKPAKDFEGGELVFTEQLPRAQSRAHVLTPGEGDAVIFTTNFRPVKGSKGYYRGTMKHGVSRVKKGTRITMGLIFHDAT